MRMLLLAIACVLSSPAFARGSNPAEDGPPVTVEQPAPKAAEWRWQPSEGVAPGLWVTHPPLEFAVDVLGIESMQRCALALEKGAGACALQLSPCQRLVLPSEGKLRLELDAACLAREATGVRLQLQPRDDAT